MGVSTKPATGARGGVRIGEETVFGVAAIPTHVIDFTSEGLAASETILESESIRPDRGRHKLIKGNRDVTGDISFEQSATGFGMLLRHALGDYIRVPGADGGIHARLETSAEDIATNPDTAANTAYILEFAGDQSARFTDAAALVCVVYKDATAEDVLTLNDNTNAGFAYTSYCGQDATYVTAVNATDNSYTGFSATTVVSATLAQVLNSAGALAAPDLNPSGGVCYIGDARERYKYFEYDSTTRKIYFSPDSISLNGNPVVGDGVISSACIAKKNSSIGLPAGALRPGSWILEFNPAWMTAAYGGTSTTATVFTHLLERGRYLPTGLTVEIDRDAAIFVYTGCKVSTLSLNFETNAIVTGTVSVVGKQEFAMAELLADAVPGDITILVDDVTAFPVNGGTLTIGEETEITYTGWTDNNDGTFTITGIPGSGAASIQRFHPEGSSVDSRTSLAATIIEFAYDNEASGPFAEGDTLTFGNGATGILLVLDDNGATGFMRVQMLTGVTPPDNNSITNGTATADVDGTPSVVAPYEGDTSPLTSFETVVHMDGSLEEVLSGSLTLNNNLNGEKFGLGSYFRLQLVEEQAVVEASLTMEFDDGKHYKRFMKGNMFSLEFKCISEADDSEISSFGVLSGAYYFMPKCKFTGSTPVIGSTSFIQHDMPVTCIVDDEHDTSDLVIFLVNDNPNDVELGTDITVL